MNGDVGDEWTRLVKNWVVDSGMVFKDILHSTVRHYAQALDADYCICYRK